MTRLRFPQLLSSSRNIWVMPKLFTYNAVGPIRLVSYIAQKSFPVQTLLWLLKFVIHNNIQAQKHQFEIWLTVEVSQEIKCKNPNAILKRENSSIFKATFTLRTGPSIFKSMTPKLSDQ